MVLLEVDTATPSASVVSSLADRSMICLVSPSKLVRVPTYLRSRTQLDSVDEDLLSAVRDVFFFIVTLS